jgi:hypothetical protein
VSRFEGGVGVGFDGRVQYARIKTYKKAMLARMHTEKRNAIQERTHKRATLFA